MDGREIVYAGNGNYMVRDVFNAWVTAGRPPINDAGRLYDKQKAARIAFENGTGSPADDPDRPDLYPLAHVRFAALDITPTPDRVRRLEAAGLVRPYSYEPWHWQPAWVYYYPLVYSIPAGTPAGDDVAVIKPTMPAPPVEDEGDELMRFLYTSDSGGSLWTLVNVATGELVQTRDQDIANTWAEAWGSAKACAVQSFLNALHAVRLTTDPTAERFNALRKAIDDITAELAKAPL